MSNFLIVSHSQLLRGNVAERRPRCDKGNLKETMIVPWNMIPHATKGHTYMSFMMCLTTLQLFSSVKAHWNIATRGPQVPHITVSISAKHGSAHFQRDRLTPCTNFVRQWIYSCEFIAVSSCRLDLQWQVTSYLITHKEWTVTLCLMM